MRLAYITGLAVLAAMSASETHHRQIPVIESSPRKKPKMRKYPAPIGPPHPKSRQHLRALMRAAQKAKITPPRPVRDDGEL